MADLIKIKEILSVLDPKNDDHWTKGGLPAMAPIEAKMGDASVKRNDVSEAIPNFNRELAASLKAGIVPGSAPAITSKVEPGAVNTPSKETDAEPEGEVTPATPMELVEAAGGDAILLLEAVVSAANSDRFRRNSQLMTLARGYQANQRSIKELQSRIDARSTARAKRNEEI